MPYSEWLKLVEACSASDYFKRWMSKDAVGNITSPIELMVLGALRYLGRGLTFDDLEEYTAINEETHRQFFHAFIDYGSKVLFPLYVTMPTTAQEYLSHQREFNIGCLPGAGFSTDATNVIMWRCAHNLKQANMGFKQSHPARTYNITCNHRRRILYSTEGHPSRWNDKTLAHFDEFLNPLHDSEILQDVEFILYSWEGEVGASRLEATRYKGAWGLVDNGYHKWSCTQAPAKESMLRSEQRFSEWLESFRKDAECTIGILKGRWRVLKTGIRVDGPESSDKIWLTCCALHNWLLVSDGLDEWNGAIGENELDDMRQHAPFALQRLTDEELRDFGSRGHEQQSAMEAARQRELRHQRGEVEDNEQEPMDNTKDDDHLLGLSQRYSVDGCVLVNSLAYDEFRNRLVEHFDIMFRKNRVKWPSRKQNSNT
ncbi:Plant transposon protein [Seminavis robusta]|uniref:Plant transposon protein n=1 Tax=Seminavis robusta TaxID=568900 RepID=A0A9N8HNW1_9STRA|nr:Plant transposon protein [Seminavis robusta]|eukprot:Sro855_g211320.1 Plant transposon protein (428) ;mRNA; r:4199-5482